VRPQAVLAQRTFASLRKHRNYRLYFASHGVSFVGARMQQIAAYWLVLELTGSPVAVGALAFVQLLPVTVFGLFVGSVIDRVNVRRALLTTQTILMLAAATLAVLTISGVVAVWQVYVLAAVQGIVLVLDNPCRHTLVFRIVGKEDLPNAVALSSSLGTMAQIVGAGLGGVVVAVAGAGAAFALNAATYVAVIGALLAMRLAREDPAERVQPTSGIVSGAREGLAFMIRSRRAAVAFFTVLLVSTLAFNVDVLLPLLAKRTLDAGPEVLGLIAAVFGVGALCGALLLATIGRASVRLLLVGAGALGVLELALAPQSTVAAVCLLLFPMGMCSVLWASSALATLQLAAPEHLRGRAASLYFFALQGGAPIGGLLAGWLTAQGGTELAFAFAGTAAVLVTIAGIVALYGPSPFSRRSKELSTATAP
jgi:MFS family permease